MGTITFPEPHERMVFANGTARVNETGVGITVLADDKSAVVHNSSTNTTDASGNISAVVDAAIINGSFYRVFTETTDNGTSPVIRIQATA